MCHLVLHLSPLGVSSIASAGLLHSWLGLLQQLLQKLEQQQQLQQH
jgi:hypothetical protein